VVIAAPNMRHRPHVDPNQKRAKKSATIANDYRLRFSVRIFRGRKDGTTLMFS
jgi:hypothetical protein